jgi:hypothetical protein
MHRGSGYLQNYLDGSGMKPLEADLSDNYKPVLNGSTVGLYVARQWHDRSQREENALLSRPEVQGLVLSSFRHDNPGPLRRNDWSA